MTRYEHYSFDLWLTLIKSNKRFKEERTRYFHQQYNQLNISLDETAAIFRQVDLMANAINEKTGDNISAEELYLMVIHQMNKGQFPLNEIALTDLYNQMELLLFEYMPYIYDTSTIETLDLIKSDGDISMNILSNTGFIKGSSLRKVLDHLKLSSYFDFQLYSDETGFSKPNPKLFEQLLKQIKTLKPQIQLNQIIHIGDNINSDIYGAEQAGLNAFLINSNHLNINHLLL